MKYKSNGYRIIPYLMYQGIIIEEVCSDCLEKLRYLASISPEWIYDINSIQIIKKQQIMMMCDLCRKELILNQNIGQIQNTQLQKTPINNN